MELLFLAAIALSASILGSASALASERFLFRRTRDGAPSTTTNASLKIDDTLEQRYLHLSAERAEPKTPESDDNH